MRRVAVSSTLIAGFIIAVVAVSSAAIFLSGAANQTSSVTTDATITQPASITSASSKNIVSGLVMVQAGGYQPYQFTVPNGTASAHVTGNFTVQGDSGKILVIIVNPANYANFQSSSPSARIYDSGQVVTSSLNVSLAPGIYYLVFANKFDASNSKMVNALVNLIYGG